MTSICRFYSPIPYLFLGRILLLFPLQLWNINLPDTRFFVPFLWSVHADGSDYVPTLRDSPVSSKGTGHVPVL